MSTDRIQGLTGNIAVKVPCKAATTANITLSGEQTIDGVACVTGDRVLVKNQSSSVNNGIYTVSTGAWIRTKDFNGSGDVRNGTIVLVNTGSTQAVNFFRLTTAEPITFGTSAITFVAVNGAFSGTYQHAGSGSVSRSIQSKLSDFIDGADFGMVGDGSTNNTTFFNNAVTAAIAAGHRRLWIPAGNYRFNTKPNNVTTTLEIFGDSMSNTVLERNYNQSGATGFLVLQANGITLRNLSINAVSGTTGGSAVHIQSTADFATSFVCLENLSLSTYGTDTWTNTLLVDGTSKTVAPIGSRDLHFRNVHVFGASSKAVLISGGVGVSWMGGGIYNAGGTDGGITITGTAGVNSYYNQIKIDAISSAIVLSECIYVDIDAPVIVGAVTNSSSAQYCTVRGHITGAVQNNWANSGVFRPQKYFGSATYDPASLADGARAETDVTVTGATLGDFAKASFSVDTQGIILDAQVTATNTVTVVFQNETGGVLDIASGTLRVEVTKPQA